MPSLRRGQGKHLNWNLNSKKSVVRKAGVYLPALTSYMPRACTISKSWQFLETEYFSQLSVPKSTAHSCWQTRWKLLAFWVLISYSSNFFSLQFLILSGPPFSYPEKNHFFSPLQNLFPSWCFLIKALSLHLGTSIVYLCTGKKSFPPRQIPGTDLIFTQWC